MPISTFITVGSSRIKAQVCTIALYASQTTGWPTPILCREDKKQSIQYSFVNHQVYYKIWKNKHLNKNPPKMGAKERRGGEKGPRKNSPFRWGPRSRPTGRVASPLVPQQEGHGEAGHPWCKSRADNAAAVCTPPSSTGPSPLTYTQLVFLAPSLLQQLVPSLWFILCTMWPGFLELCAFRFSR